MASAQHNSRKLIVGALLCLFGTVAARAQAPDSGARGETVSWSLQTQGTAAPDARLKIQLQGSVAEGWHVYSLKQANEGPTPLLVRLDANPVAIADGAVRESPPENVFEPAFGAQTQLFSKPFTITVPVRLKAGTEPGEQKIPLSVRFQTCNGNICQPPKTVRLSALVNLQAGK